MLDYNTHKNWKQLQEENQEPFKPYERDSEEYSNFLKEYNLFEPTLTPSYMEVYEGPERSPLMEQVTRTGGIDYLGNSVWDISNPTTGDLSNLGDIRAENQPWYSKIGNGMAKAGVLALTTAAEFGGLVYGVGQGIFAKNDKSFLQDLWDNPITQALQNINELSEEYMPNYYTRHEQEDPLGSIFTANFLGDSLIKNFGFMVGAFYGGMPLAAGMGKIGTAFVKGVREAAVAEGMGMAERFGELTAKYGDDLLGKVGSYGREIRGLSGKTAAQIGEKYGDDVVKAYNDLKAAHLTEGERGLEMLKGLDAINKAARTTRATTQTLGSLGSAINEGAIEAINNSRDWATKATQEENERYQIEIAEIDDMLGDTPEGIQEKYKAAEKHQAMLAGIELDKAKMGNVDLIWNLPILMVSNMYQLGRLYTRGFDSTRRQLGSFWNGHRLSGTLGNLKSDKNWKKGLLSAFSKANTEGAEEYLQRAASDSSGKESEERLNSRLESIEELQKSADYAVDDSIERFMTAGSGEQAEKNVWNYLTDFGKAIVDNSKDPQAWQEYIVGALSSLVGMPVFGSQTSKAYGPMKDNGVFGFAGGLWGNMEDYMAAKKNEDLIAKHLNDRVNKKEFKELYENLKKQNDYDAWLQEEIAKGDKSKYKDLELESFYHDINAAAASGHLEEFKQLVGFNKEYTDDELKEIVKQTTTTLSVEDQIADDKMAVEDLQNARASLEKSKDEIGKWTESMKADYDEYGEELEKIQARLKQYEDSQKEGSTVENPYKDKQIGPFIDVNGEMNVKNPEKMREILERNRNNLLQGIDDYLKIRDDIDIESDGRLDDKTLETLTMMRGKILNYEIRSPEMADDIVKTVLGTKVNFDDIREKQHAEVEKAQRLYDNTLDYLEKAKKKGAKKKEIEKKQEEHNIAKAKLNKAKASEKRYEDLFKLLELLAEEHPTTVSERVAMARGRGDNIVESSLAAFDRNQTRTVNTEEVQGILRNPAYLDAFYTLVDSRLANLRWSDRLRLKQEAQDLAWLSLMKLSYNKKIREALGDKIKPNEAFRNPTDRLKKEQLDTMAEKLYDRIKDVKSLYDLDTIVREANTTNSDIVQLALKKVKEGSNEDLKRLVNDYENALDNFESFRSQIRTIEDPNTRANVDTVAVDEFQNALYDDDGSADTYSKFLSFMEEAAKALEKESDNPFAKKEAEAIRKIMKDLKDAVKSVTTRSTGKTIAAPDASSLAATVAARVRKKDPEEAKKEEEEEKDKDKDVDTRDDLLDAIKDEITKKDVKSFSALSEDLRKRIDKFNEDVVDEKSKVTESDMANIMQDLFNEEIKKSEDSFDDVDESGDDEIEVDSNKTATSAKRAEMKEVLRTTFKSDRITRWHQDSRDYKIPYTPTDEVKKTIQDMLIELKAYDFLDRNYLGYLVRGKERLNYPKVHFLKSTKSEFDNAEDSPVFIAIEWNDNVEDTIRKYATNGDKASELAVSPVNINGKQYQIIGVVAFDETNAADEIQKAYSSFKNGISNELDAKIEDARNAGDSFVVSELESQIDSIFTGRLEKFNDEKDSREKVDLFTFMTSQQGSNDRAVSSEWNTWNEKSPTPVKWHFGTVVNKRLNVSAELTDYQEPNDEWLESHNGAVLLFVPKPDGQLYPIRCTRKTVTSWLDSIVDGKKTGAQLLADVLAGNSNNKYIGNIVDQLKVLFNKDATIYDRMQAKTMLHRYFILGKESPIHFDVDEVKLFGTTVYGDSFEEKVANFFQKLSDRGIKFSLPTASIESIDGRDIIESGVLEVGLRGFYNYNSNFTIVPIDGEGKLIAAPEVIGDTNPAAVSPNRKERTYDFGNGSKTYYIESDGTVTLNGRPAPTDEANLVIFVENVTKENKHFGLMYKKGYNWNSAQQKFIFNNLPKSFENIYMDTVNGEVWIYNGNNIPGERVYRLYESNGETLTELGKKLVNDFREAVQNITSATAESRKKFENLTDTSSASDDSAVVRNSSEENKDEPEPAKPGTPVKGYFAGRELKDLDSKTGGLEGWLAENKNSPIVKGNKKKGKMGVFEALQKSTCPFDEGKLLNILNDSNLSANDKREQALDEINNCHKGR